MRIYSLLVICFLFGCAASKPGDVPLPADVSIFPDSAISIQSVASLAGREMSELDGPGADWINAGSFSIFNVSESEITALSSSGDSKQVYLGDQKGSVYRLSVANRSSKKGEFQQLLKTRNKVHSLSLSPDGKYLAVGQTARVLVLDLENNRLFAKLPRLLGKVTAIDWDPRGQLLALGRSNGDILVWNLRDAPSGGLIRADSLELYRQSGSPVTKLLFHPLGRVFFAGHRNGEVVLWRLLRTEQEIGVRDSSAVADEDEVGRRRQTVKLANRITDLAFSKDSKRLYISSSDGNITLLKIRGLRLLGSYSDSRSGVSSLTLLSLNSGASVIVSTARDKQLDFWCDREGELELIAQSQFLAESTDILADSSRGSYLWGTQKSGNLLGFNGDFLTKTPKLSQALGRCI